MSGSVSTNDKSSNRIELSWFSQQFLNFYWFDLNPPINPSTHPPTHQTVHPPLGGGVSTNFKSSNRIEISWLVQVLLNFDWFLGSPPRMEGGERAIDIEPLSLTLHSVIAHFIHHPSNVENYSISHKWKTSQPKKKVCQIHIFIHLSADFGLTIQNTQHYRSRLNFSTSGKLALNGPSNGAEVTYSKIQNRLNRTPQDTPMDWFLMQYINNKCALILSESVKTVVLIFGQPIAPPLVFWIKKQIGPWFSLGNSPPKTKLIRG